MKRIGILLALASIAVFGCAGAPEQNAYSGYYRQGFEQSDFYTKDGDGPYWLSADTEVWDEIMTHLVQRPGRGSFVTLELNVEGTLESGGDHAHLGAYKATLHAMRIIELTPISDDQYTEAVAHFAGDWDGPAEVAH